ncbi:TBPIP-domain-containing protein [Crucibulum laeve]|uniref:TBPIP-domain-containing protein n=1 Tax=Crucibulum laeve TaxID=68775 RepID=A0A5C3MGT3_9AGAR|nr:TBPIP-domain-containing protein [Crucibulum laeve]
MATKTKSEAKVPVLKGQEAPAEAKVLQYVKKMNRPYGAVDVAANLKGAVPKTATQKILVALAEKGELVQKTYGKTTFFVANQANMESIPGEKITAIESEIKSIEEENKLLAVEIKSSAAELAKVKTTPTNIDLQNQIEQTEAAIAEMTARLEPLRSGAPPISAEDLAQVNADWTKWRAEWVRRKKIFTTFWHMISDTLPPQEARVLEEDLGIELDTPEHCAIERELLAQKSGNSLKRKRC